MRGEVSRLALLADELIDLPDDVVAALLAEMSPDELELVDMAMANRVEDEWRRDPAAMASHLDPSVRSWPYVRCLADAVRRAVEGESNRILIMLPARYGKTKITSVWGAAWALDRYPWLQVVLASYGKDLAMANSLEVRDILSTHAGVLRAKIRRDKAAQSRWKTSAGGQVMAVGVGSGLTGHGAHLAIVDDPFKDWQEAHSPTTRETVWNWYKSVLRTRLQDDESAIIVVGTRWHEDDLVGRLLAPPDDTEKDDWEVIRIPAIAEAPDPNGKPWEQLPDPLGRAPGEPIETERFTLETVQGRMRALGSYLSAGMEQQRPSSAEGGILKRAWWRYYAGRPDPNTWDDCHMSWDSSFDDAAGSSFCVGQFWARIGSQKYLIDQVRDRMDYPTFKQTVTSFKAKWAYTRVGRVLIEDKANGPAVIKDLYGIVPGLVPRSPMGSKESRAHACAGEVEGGDIWLPDPGLNDIDRDVDRSFVHAFVDECALFPGGTNDDQVDSFTQAILEWKGADVPATSNYRRAAGASRR